MRIKLRYVLTHVPPQRMQRLLRASGIFWIAALLLPVAALAQSSGSPFDTGFTSLQNLFTGTIAKVASLIAIVVGGYMFAHGDPGAKRSQNPVILGFQGRSQMEARYGEDAEAMLAKPATKIFLRTTEPRAAKWVSEAIGEIEVERLRETHYEGSRAGRNFALDRQTEPLVLPSEISGLEDLRGFLKYGNHVARFSFPYIALEEKHSAFVERKMDDLIVPPALVEGDTEPDEDENNEIPVGERSDGYQGYRME
jgi:type IV secretory pathway VirB2 component (pilin)